MRSPPPRLAPIFFTLIPFSGKFSWIIINRLVSPLWDWQRDNRLVAAKRSKRLCLFILLCRLFLSLLSKYPLRPTHTPENLGSATGWRTIRPGSFLGVIHSFPSETQIHFWISHSWQITWWCSSKRRRIFYVLVPYDVRVGHWMTSQHQRLVRQRGNMTL